MSYEQFRNDLAAALLSVRSIAEISDILAAVDRTAETYEFTRRCTDLSLVMAEPEILVNYIASLAVEHLSPITLKNYRRMIAHFLWAVRKPYSEVTVNDIRLYLYNYKQERHVSDHTISQIRNQLHAFYAWCVDEEYMERNPVRRIRPIKYAKPQRHALSSLDLERLRHVCATLRQKALIDFLYSTGCRVSECCAVKTADVDWERRAIVLTETKGDKVRTVYLNAECIVSLKAYLESRSDDCPYLFTTERNPHRQLQVRSVQDELSKLASRAGITVPVSPHIIRHTMATQGLRAGIPVEHIQRMLGHSNIATTMIYAEVDDTAVHASHERLT